MDNNMFVLKEGYVINKIWLFEDRCNSVHVDPLFFFSNFCQLPDSIITCRKYIYVFFITLNLLPGITIDCLLWYFKVASPINGFRFTVFCTFDTKLFLTLSRSPLTIYNGSSRIINIY